MPVILRDTTVSNMYNFFFLILLNFLLSFFLLFCFLSFLFFFFRLWAEKAIVYRRLRRALPPRSRRGPWPSLIGRWGLQCPHLDLGKGSTHRGPHSWPARATTSSPIQATMQRRSSAQSYKKTQRNKKFKNLSASMLIVPRHTTGVHISDFQ